MKLGNRSQCAALTARMYAPKPTLRDRSGAIAAVVAIHAALGFALLNLAGKIDVIAEQPALDVFDVTEVTPPPKPPARPVVQRTRTDRPREREGAASPRNIRSEATPVVAPKPKIELPAKPPIAVAQQPGQGAAPTQGASAVRGPGTGAGGVGTGSGSGGAGSGSGGGGGGIATRSGIIRGITNRDYPVQIQRRWPRDGQIFVRLRIEPNGRPSQCEVMRSYGDPVADQWTCRLLTDRGVFRPALDRRGQPVADWLGYVQRDLGRFDR